MSRVVQFVPRRFRSGGNVGKYKKPSAAELDNEALAVTREVAKQLKKKYYDPSNVSLDFSLPNAELIRKIEEDAKDRMHKRIKKPAEDWQENHPIDMVSTRKRLRNLIWGARISLNKNFSPLDVGDVVLLDLESTELHLVVDKPKDLNTSTYTLLNHEGDIKYIVREQIRLRVPKVASNRILNPLKVVQQEKKYLGVAPIGMPDSKFSRSAEALPDELRKEKAGLEASPKRSDGEFLTTGDDFIMAQAASQLLTDTDVKTYIVPLPVRRLLSKALVEASITCFRKVNSYSRNLDYIHKILQYDENNNVISSARSIPIFELFEIFSKFEHRVRHLDQAQGVDELRVLNSQMTYLGLDGPTIVGKKYPDQTKAGFDEVEYSATSYIAYLVALAQNPRKWKINFQHSSKTPLSVDVLPISTSVDASDALGFLKADGGKTFTKFYTDFYANKKDIKPPHHLRQVMSLLKDFVAGNIVEDKMVESVVGNLLRNIDHSLDANGLRKMPVIPYSYDFSKSRALEIIYSLENNEWYNPSKWQAPIRLPGTGLSPEADVAKAYYDFIDKKFSSKEDLEKALNATPVEPSVKEAELLDFNDGLSTQDESSVFDSWVDSDFNKSDPCEKVRYDFADVPIYCIDAATAHEIDDGISIEDRGNDFRFTIHVADASSFIKQSSMLSQIALGKGATVYMPEGPSLMLPQFVSKVCGLDATNNNRSFAIEFTISKSSIIDYEASRSSIDAKYIMKQVSDSCRVRFLNIKSNSRCITYEQVNNILNDESNIEKFAKGSFEKGGTEWALFNLSRVATIFGQIRAKHMGALNFPGDSSKISVDYLSREEVGDKHFERTKEGYKMAIVGRNAERVPVVTIENNVHQSEDSKSLELVLNFMVTANHAASEFAFRKNVPIILRTQKLSWRKRVAKEVKEILAGNKDSRVSAKEMVELGKFLTAANYQVKPCGHESLGLPRYAHFTSPLRRYADMVNHWIMAHYLMNQKHPRSKEVIFDDDAMNNLSYVANHLQICQFVVNHAQKDSDLFWQGSFLKQYFECLQAGEIEDPIEFEFLLLSDPKRGDVSCRVTNFSGLRTTIVANDTLKQLFESGEYEIGKAVKPKFTVKKIDLIEHEFTVELEST